MEKDTPNTLTDDMFSSPSAMDDAGERSGPSNNIDMQVYKLDMKNPGDKYENESRTQLEQSIK